MCREKNKPSKTRTNVYVDSVQILMLLNKKIQHSEIT